MNNLLDIPKPNRVSSPVKFYINRDDEINAIVNKLRRDQDSSVSGKICMVYGASGVGKTELCRAAARRLRSEYPDAQIYIRVDENDPDRLALFKIVETLIHIFEPYARVSDDLTTLGDQYRSVLTGKRVLIILDGLRSGQFLDLLPQPASCGLLITICTQSNSLSGEAITLSEFSQENSEKLLINICPRAGARAADLASICRNIPGNLCLVAGYLNYNPAIAVGDFVDEFNKNSKQIAGQVNILTERIVSFLLERLTVNERDFFLRLSILSGGFDKALAREVYPAEPKEDVSLEVVEAHLDTFARLNLLTYDQAIDYYYMSSAIQDYALKSLGNIPEAWNSLGKAFADSMEWYNSFASGGADEYLLGLLILDERKSAIKNILQYLLDQVSVERDRILLRFRDLLCSLGSSRFAPRIEQIPLLEAMLEASIRLHEREKSAVILGDLSHIYGAIGEREKSHYYSELQSEAFRDNLGAHAVKPLEGPSPDGPDDKRISNPGDRVKSESMASAIEDLSISELKVILTGFMGTGKTTVGRLLAKNLHYRFIDTDELIESRHNRSIAEIFQVLGEDSFREMERSLVKELADLEGVVISTGGRLMLDPENVVALSRNSRVLCLVATPDEILTRVKNDKSHKRPLLAVPNPHERIVELLQERNNEYLRFPQVVTDEKEPGEIARSLVEFVNTNPKSLVIENPQENYEYIVGAGLLPFLRQLTGIQGEVVIITDQAVKGLYGPSCASIGRIIEIPSGPQHKSLATVQFVYGQLLEEGFDRNGTIISLGGSTVGDIAGYIAATYMRGVNFIQCPTSLIAMVDTSVGGKVSIDLPEGKNVIGVYKQPAKVIADVATLQTLPQPDFIAGMAEVIKHGLVAESGLLEQVESGHWAKNWDRSPTYIGELQRLVAQAIQVKINIVQADPFEQGLRSTLNLGHTFAYAIEQVSYDAYRHGEAVSMGLVAVANLSARLGFCDDFTSEAH